MAAGRQRPAACNDRNGPRNFFGFALGVGVEATDDSLELGELFDHVGDEVAFGEFGGAVGASDVCMRNSAGEPLLREPPRDGAHAFDFIAVTSEARFVGNGVELRQVVGEPIF